MTYWGSEVSEDVEEPAEEPVAETEPHEADTYVYGEDESQAADEAPAEPAAEAAEEPAHEVVADGSRTSPPRTPP